MRLDIVIPSTVAMSSNVLQNADSNRTLVECPAILTERLILRNGSGFWRLNNLKTISLSSRGASSVVTFSSRAAGELPSGLRRLALKGSARRARVSCHCADPECFIGVCEFVFHSRQVHETSIGKCH